MKNLILMLVILTGCASAPERRSGVQVKDVPVNARESRDDEPRKRILILPFIDISHERDPAVAESARKALLKSIAMTKSFLVIDNSDFPKDIKTFRVNDQYDIEAIGKIANGMGIPLVLEGRIIEVRAKRLGDQVGFMRKIKARMEAKVQVRVMGAKQGRELLNEMREASVESITTHFGSYAYSDKALQEDPDLIDQVVQKAFKGVMPTLMNISRKITWEGKIAMVTGDRIFVNAGRLSGVQVGDILRVNDEGSEVYDPESGQLIGRAPGRMKGTLEVISYFGKDGAIAVVHSGSGFKEADLVEFY